MQGIECTVRGHPHELVEVRRIVQHGTGAVGHLLECPTGAYRFLFIEGVHNQPDSPGMPRTNRPRWGWKD